MIEIRLATADDEVALQQLDEDTWSPTVTPAPRRTPPRPFFTETSRPDDVLVAILDGTVAGYARLHQPSPLPSHAHVLQVNGLAVSPAAQGHGVGRALVESAKWLAGRRGATKLTLRVLGDNEPARRLYAACGFVVEGVLAGEFVLEGRPVDDVLMACRLDPTAG